MGGLDPSASSLLVSGLIGLLGLATVGGFCAGLACAPWIQEWFLKRAHRKLERLCDATASHLDRSATLCERLAALSESLAPDRWQTLDQRRQRFAHAWQMLESQQSLTSATIASHEESAESAIAPKPFTITWLDDPSQTDRAVSSRAAFDQNLAHLLTVTTTERYPSGLLLVRMDKVEQLLKRLGPGPVDQLRRDLQAVITGAVRSQDLVGEWDSDSWGILLPSLSPLAGLRIAEQVRSAVRQHRFQLDDRGPEMLVTASFGYAAILPTESPGTVLDRAQEALIRSQAVGRNQLHAHDAQMRGVTRVG